MIQIDPIKCIHCGSCASDCFPHALTMTQEKPVLEFPEYCLHCGHCIAVCPVNAVTDDELNMEEIRPAGSPVNADDLLLQMQSRRSCRHYQKKAVPDELVTALIQAAKACPTAKNLQDIRFIAVTDKIDALLDAALATLGRLGEMQLASTEDPNELRRAHNFISWSKLRASGRTFDPLFFHAPQLLLFVSSSATANDTAAGAAYAELMASALGLGCLYSGYFTACAANSPEIQKMLSLSPSEQVVRCLVLGYPSIRFFRTTARNTPEVTCL